jgi:hypothetical protein
MIARVRVMSIANQGTGLLNAVTQAMPAGAVHEISKSASLEDPHLEIVLLARLGDPTAEQWNPFC